MSCDEFRVGEYRRHMRLGTEAVYKVRGQEGQLVVVEVVVAPGLQKGHRLRLTAQAVRSMTLVAPTEPGDVTGSR